jgi:hypothetical protein
MRIATFIGIAALAVACGPGARESHNSSQAGATARTGETQPGLQPTVTLTGCLVDADQRNAEPVGTVGAAKGSAGTAADQRNAGAGSPGERFTLTNAKSESADSSPAAASYVLDGNMEDLRELANQKVRLTGVLDAAAANTAGPQRIRVGTVESAGGTCNGK